MCSWGAGDYGVWLSDVATVTESFAPLTFIFHWQTRWKEWGGGGRGLHGWVEAGVDLDLWPLLKRSARPGSPHLALIWGIPQARNTLCLRDSSAPPTVNYGKGGGLVVHKPSIMNGADVLKGSSDHIACLDTETTSGKGVTSTSYGLHIHMISSQKTMEIHCDCSAALIVLRRSISSVLVDALPLAENFRQIAV